MSMYAMIETKSGNGELPRELDPKKEGLVYGLNLATSFELLNELAKELGIEPLGTFVYEDWEDFGEEVQEYKPQQQKEWHDPADCLHAVTALVKSFRKPDRGKFAAGIEQDSEGILWDLTAYEMILKQAVVEKDPFRIVIM